MPGTEVGAGNKDPNPGIFFMKISFFDTGCFFFYLTPMVQRSHKWEGLGLGEHVTMPQFLPIIFNIIKWKQAG